MNDNLGLDDRKIKAIDLIIKGENISKVAEIVGCARQTVYDWLKDDKFKAEMDRQTTELKKQIDKKLLINVEPLLDKLIKIALKSKADKTSLDACIYALNRLAGTPTSKVADVTEDTGKTKETIDLDIVKDKVHKVIDITEHKEKKAE